MEATGEVTRLLADVHEGDRSAYDRLFALVYDELRRVARRQLRRERPGHTLHTAALVHEAYMRMAGNLGPAIEGREHFLGIAARAMRQILVDYARSHCAEKRGGNAIHTSLSNKPLGIDVHMEEVVALDRALLRLGDVDPRLRDLVECRFFGGLTSLETAKVLGVTERTVERGWARARAWLYSELYREGK